MTGYGEQERPVDLATDKADNSSTDPEKLISLARDVTHIKDIYNGFGSQPATCLL